MLERALLLMGRVRDTPGTLLCVVGALPPAMLVHWGQHYNPMLNDRLFEDLSLPRRDA